MDTATDVRCPNCDGEMWDNRETKRNSRAPDFKCKKRGCEGVIWPDKHKQVIETPARGDRRGNERERLRPVADEDNELMPEWMKGKWEEEAAEIMEKIGKDDKADPAVQARCRYAAAKLAAVRFSLTVLKAQYDTAGITLTDDVAHKHAYELWKMWCDRKMVS